MEIILKVNNFKGVVKFFIKLIVCEFPTAVYQLFIHISLNPFGLLYSPIKTIMFTTAF